MKNCLTGCRYLVLMLGLMAAGVPLCASAWEPSRPVALIAGSAAGGGIDLTARLMQRIWERQRVVNPPVIVINKPGAGNSVAWQYLNERNNDGHAIAIGTANLVSNPVMNKSLLGHRDLHPLALLFDDYFIFMVRADAPEMTIANIKERLRKDPGALAFGFGPGVGSGTHIAAAMAAKAMGADVRKGRFIPYRNAGEAVAGMLSGQIDIVSGTAVTAIPFLGSGRVRALCVIAPRRLGGRLAQVATIKEYGVEVDFVNWRGVVGPKGMAKHHVAYWTHALEELNRSPEWQKEIGRNFWSANLKTGAEFDRFLRDQEVLFRRIWSEIGL